MSEQECKKVFFVCMLIWICAEAKPEYHPDAFLTLEQKVIKHGYPVELYEITTEDDYMLPLYRIPHGPNDSGNESKNRSIVMFLHGMGGTPENYVLLGNESVPYYLVDRGFEVWLFSARGNQSPFNRHHKKLNWNENPQFWIFSFEEIGIYDLTSTIDFILEKTKQESLFLVGHSAGGTYMYTMLAERPEYNKKVKIGVSWGNAPVIKHSDYSNLHLVASIGDLLKGIVKYLEMTELFPHLQLFKPLIRDMCSDPEFIKLCIKYTWFIGSHQSYIQENEIIKLVTTSGTPRLSVNLPVHYMDNIISGRYQKFDYGKKENMKRYGQKQPPLYNASAVTAPMVFFFGPYDRFFTKEDFEESAELLPNVVLLYEVKYEKFTHTDFIVSRNSSELVYEPLYKLFKDYDEGIIPPRHIRSKTPI